LRRSIISNLAQDAQVAAVQALLGGRLDRLASRVRADRGSVEPEPRVNRHPGGLAGVHGVAHRLLGMAKLPCQPGHHVGERDLIAELHLQTPQRRLGAP